MLLGVDAESEMGRLLIGKPDSLKVQVIHSHKKKNGLSRKDKEELYSMVNRRDVLNYAFETHGTKAEHLWEKYPTHEVLRHSKSAKWYGLLADITKDKVSLAGEGRIDILVLKCEPEMITSLVSQKGFAPAYHMNKKHWLTVLLDGTLKDDIVYNLLDMSYGLAGK